MPDPPRRSQPPSAESMLLAVDSERAHALLHSIAVELASSAPGVMPASLHVRALALKREVARWAEAAPHEAQRSATIHELLDLQERVREERRKP